MSGLIKNHHCPDFTFNNAVRSIKEILWGCNNIYTTSPVFNITHYLRIFNIQIQKKFYELPNLYD